MMNHFCQLAPYSTLLPNEKSIMAGFDQNGAKCGKQEGIFRKQNLFITKEVDSLLISLLVY